MAPGKLLIQMSHLKRSQSTGTMSDLPKVTEPVSDVAENKTWVPNIHSNILCAAQWDFWILALSFLEEESRRPWG